MSIQEQPSLVSSHPSVNSTLQSDPYTPQLPTPAQEANQPADEKQFTDENGDAPVKGVVDHPKALEAGINDPGADIIIVDWDGPDDVMNPKKFAFTLPFLMDLITERMYAWQLVKEEEVGCDNGRVFVHIYFSHLFVHDVACSSGDRPGLSYYKFRRSLNDSLRFHPRLWYVLDNMRRLLYLSGILTT